MSGEVDPHCHIGILGGGQLGRMLALEGYRLGIAFHVLDPKPNVSASKVCEHLHAEYDDLEAVDRLRARADRLTYEFENVPAESLERIEGRPIHPPPRALETSGDRLVEKQLFHRLEIETARIATIDSASDLAEATDTIGTPLVVKTRRMGYDGKGQTVVEDATEAHEAWREIGERPAIAEEMVEFDRELSVIGVRAADGSKQIYPLVENIHREGILVESHAPAPEVGQATRTAARDYCRRLLHELDYVGILALELFDTDAGLLANEFAPRVHNSGHWTIEGTETSQFENHVRAVADLPLGSTEAVGHTRMLNVIGEWPDRRELLSHPAVRLHDYEKSPRPGRKIGHVTLHADTAAAAAELADEIRPIVEETRDLG